MIFRGIASAPFGARNANGDTYRPGAFNRQIKQGRSVPILWNSHDNTAPVVGKTSSLFATALGLAFGFELADTSHYGLEIVQGRMAGASISAIHQEVEENDDEVIVHRADLVHVSIVPNADAAAGRHTAIWRADDEANLEAASERIRNFNASWETAHGFHLHLASLRARNSAPRHQPAPASPTAYAMNPNLLAQMVAAFRNGQRGCRIFGLPNAYAVRLRQGR